MYTSDFAPESMCVEMHALHTCSKARIYPPLHLPFCCPTSALAFSALPPFSSALSPSLQATTSLYKHTMSRLCLYSALSAQESAAQLFAELRKRPSPESGFGPLRLAVHDFATRFSLGLFWGLGVFKVVLGFFSPSKAQNNRRGCGD